MPNFEQFKAKIDAGMMHTNRTMVICNKLGGDSHLLCRTAHLPVISIQHFEFKQTGHGLRIPNEFTYDPLILSFFIDKNGSPYNEAYKWIDSILSENYQFRDMSTYEEDITVTEYTPDDKPVGVWKYEGCYPTVISPREKTNLTGELDLFTITLMYKQMSYTT